MIVSRSLPHEFNITGRTLEGRAYGYGVPALVTDDCGASHYFEQLLRGADTKTIRDRAGSAFPLLVWHSRTSNLGQMPTDQIGDVRFAPSDDGLDFTAVVSRSRLGDEMLELASEGTAEDVSVSYKPLRNIDGVHEGRPLVSRAEIALRELSLCPTGTGQHDGAKVLVMRAAGARKLAGEPNCSPASFDAPRSTETRLRLLNLW